MNTTITDEQTQQIVDSIPQNKRMGVVRSTCPLCRDHRGNPKDKSMVIHFDKHYVVCHHCGAVGHIPATEEERKQWAERQRRSRLKSERQHSTTSFTRPEYDGTFLVSDSLLADAKPETKALIDYLTDERGISIETLRHMKVTLPYTRAFNPDKKSEQLMEVIAFNYFEHGQLVNTKFRPLYKDFRLVPGAELIPYNIDSIRDTPVCYITEGELDALSLIQCGYEATISVPNGAQQNLPYLNRFIETHFDNKVCIILALDNDRKGIMLRNELVRRLGVERCQVVHWPEDCKDANEVLTKHGAERLRDCIEAHTDIPLTGILTAQDVEADLLDLFQNGMKHGASSGLSNLDRLVTWELGRYMVVSGRPGDGKSEFLDELVLRLSLRQDWGIAFFSPENNPIKLHLRKLCEKLTGYPFEQKGRMTIDLFHGCVKWLTRNVCHIVPELGDDGVVTAFDDSATSNPQSSIVTPPSSTTNPPSSNPSSFLLSPSSSPLNPPSSIVNHQPSTTASGYQIEDILHIAKLAVMRRGVRIIVIDPLNRIDKGKDYLHNDLEWYAHVNNILSRFAIANNCLVILVAHPRKVDRTIIDGRKRRVEMNDINGSADFGNKSDYCLIVDRDDDLKITTVFMDKVKFKHLGGRGECLFEYSMMSGRYSPCSLRRVTDELLFEQGIQLSTNQQIVNRGPDKYIKTTDLQHLSTQWIDTNGEHTTTFT